MASPTEVPDKAPKTFFVEPDISLINEAFLETAFFHGFECYSIPRHFSRNLREKVPRILDQYEEVLLFFTIDRDDSLEDWKRYIEGLQSHTDFHRRIGVLTSPFVSPVSLAQIKKTFLLEMGLLNGCVELSQSIPKSRERVLEALGYCDARGRRKVIRSPGTSSDIVKFREARVAKAIPIRDLSISHFTVILKPDDPDWSLGSKLPNVCLRFGSAVLFVDCVLAVKRPVTGGNLCVFVLQYGGPGDVAAQRLKSRINSCVFEQHQKATLHSALALFADEGEGPT